MLGGGKKGKIGGTAGEEKVKQGNSRLPVPKKEEPASDDDDVEPMDVKEEEDEEVREVVPCPSTQQSGGQGGTVMPVDMKRFNGTFPVTYDMIVIPDQLDVLYENEIIYSTGGLVSGVGSTEVRFKDFCFVRVSCWVCSSSAR